MSEEYERIMAERRATITTAGIPVTIEAFEVPGPIADDQGGMMLREMAKEMGKPIFVPVGSSKAHGGKLFWGVDA